MSFLQPLALFGLAFALVPPLLHLFQRRRPQDVVFPSVRYLRQTAREAQRSIRLRHLVLLLLRVAAVVLLVLAAARPVVPARVGGLHAPTALAVVLDHSLSSGAVVGGRRVLDDLAQRAGETLREARGSDVLWLIGADGLARRGGAEEFAGMARTVRPAARRLDLAAAVALAGRLVRSAGAAEAEVHVLSDLQRSAFGRGDGAPGADSSAAGLTVLVYHPSGAPPPNRGVVEAEAEPATWVLGSGGVVARLGGAPLGTRQAAVTVRLGGRVVARTAAAAGDAFAVSVSGQRAGWLAGEVALEPDELRADDQRAFAVRVAEPATVLVEAGADLGRFVGDALAVLAGAGQVRPGSRGGIRLGETARVGAGIVFPPHDPLQLGAANRALDAVGAGWRFGAPVALADTVVAPGVAVFAGARVHRRYRLEPAPTQQRGAVLARVGGDPWLVRSGATVIVGSRFVPEETDLPLSAAFVPAVASLVLRVARGEEAVVTAAPGDPVRLPEGVDGLATGARGARAAAVTVAPTDPGVYPLLAGSDTVGALVVAADARESDLTRATDAEVSAALPGARVRVTSTARTYAAARFAGAGRSDLTPWLLVAALAVLTVESLVAAGVRRRDG